MYFFYPTLLYNYSRTYPSVIFDKSFHNEEFESSKKKSRWLSIRSKVYIQSLSCVFESHFANNQ